MKLSNLIIPYLIIILTFNWRRMKTKKSAAHILILPATG